MNTFVKNLLASDAGIKSKRANIIGRQAKTAQEKLVLNLRSQKDDLEAKKTALEDLFPDSTISLKVGGENFDAEEWVTNMQDIKVSLLEIEVRLTEAEETLKEYFGETEEEAEKE